LYLPASLFEQQALSIQFFLVQNAQAKELVTPFNPPHIGAKQLQEILFWQKTRYPQEFFAGRTEENEGRRLLNRKTGHQLAFVQTICNYGTIMGSGSPFIRPQLPLGRGGFTNAALDIFDLP